MKLFNRPLGKRLAKAALAGAAVALLSLGPVASGASAATPVGTGDSVFIGPREGYPGTGVFPVWSTTPPTGTPDFWAYCIEHDIHAKTNLNGTVNDPSGYLGANLFKDADVKQKVLWIIQNSYPAKSLEEFGIESGAPGISRNDAIEATQYAIWRYTDLGFDAGWNFETPDSGTAYWYLVNKSKTEAPVTPADVQVSLTGPAAAQTADSLVGPFKVSTNQSTVNLTASPTQKFVDAAGNPIDATKVTNGQEVFLDLRGSKVAGDSTVTATASGVSGVGKILNVPEDPGTEPSSESHAQSLILVGAAGSTTSKNVQVSWRGVPTENQNPVIGTTLVNATDGGKSLPAAGGRLIDHVAYQNLIPGTAYTVTGHLVRQADGKDTGITGKVTFTPTTANGTVDVQFTVPAGFAGTKLVAFERLFEGSVATGEPVAIHEDLNSAAQTISIETAPAALPVIGTTLVNATDGGKSLSAAGGPLIDHVTYQNLIPGTAYTVTGHLVRQTDGTDTGITGKVTFTPTTANGTVDVQFTVPAGFAGTKLVAFERLFEGSVATGEPVAIHEDLNSTAQTISIETAPATTPAITETPSSAPTAPTPPSLPNTGAGSVLGVGTAALAAIAAGLLLMRRGAKRA